VIFFDTQALMMPRQGVRVQWKWDPQGTAPSTVEVVVERSEAPLGPFVEIGVVDPRVTFSFFDEGAPLRKQNGAMYWRVRAVSRQTGATLHTSHAFGFDEPLGQDALLIIEQQNVMLEGVNGHPAIKGRPVTVYKQINVGPKCPACIDQETGRIAISNCRACVGTGVDGGYYDPVTVGMNLMPYANAVQLLNLQAVGEVDSTAVMNNFPVVDPGDILVERSEKHWRVTRTDPRERNRSLVRQVLFLSQLKPDDVAAELLRHRDNGGRST